LSQTNAQIVNIEDKRANRADTVAWHGRLNIGFNLADNGSTVVTFKGGINLEHVNNRHWFLSLTNYNLVQVEQQDFINDGFQHFRYNYQINSILTYEAFTQAQYNEKLKLRLRWLMGSGLRFTVLNQEKHKVFLGLTYMYEFNRESEPEKEFRDHRMSTYLSINVKPFKNAKLSNTTYYQPVLNNLKDLRLSSQTALVINLTKKLLFTTIFNITYDSRVPESVTNTFYSFRNGVRFNF